LLTERWAGPQPSSVEPVCRRVWTTYNRRKVNKGRKGRKIFISVTTYSKGQRKKFELYFLVLNALKWGRVGVWELVGDQWWPL
jgi:hypothetical protein